MALVWLVRFPHKGPGEATTVILNLLLEKPGLREGEELTVTQQSWSSLQVLGPGLCPEAPA